MKTAILKLSLLLIAFMLSTTLFAQDNAAYEKAKTEIQEQFGTFPTLFKVYPKHALAGAWENFKQLNGPDSKIPPKYRELLQLAVASQIPCAYCVYFHTNMAKAFGATEMELQEAVAHGASTRQWSMVLQGSQVELKAFKTEFDAMMKHMTEKSKK